MGDQTSAQVVPRHVDGRPLEVATVNGPVAGHVNERAVVTESNRGEAPPRRRAPARGHQAILVLKSERLQPPHELQSVVCRHDVAGLGRGFGVGAARRCACRGMSATSAGWTTEFPSSPREFGAPIVRAPPSRPA